MLSILFAAVLLTGGLTQPAQAALQAVGPNALFNPGGFTYPVWYQDFAGLRLDLCAILNDPFCFPEGLPAAGTFPDEAFYWSAGAAILPTDPGALGTDGLLDMAMEAAFGGILDPGAAIVGNEMTFGRIRIRIDVPLVGTYTVSHPFGTATYVVDAVGAGLEINETQDIGCDGELEPVNCNFALALLDGPGTPEVPGEPVANVSATGASIGPFLRPSLTPGGEPLLPIPSPLPTSAGALFIANPAVPTNVTGSPVGQNFFRITGPGGINVTQELFGLMGLVSGTQPAQVEKAEYRVKTGKFHAEGHSLLIESAPGVPTVITVRLGDALGPVIGTSTVAPTGLWSVTGKVPFSPGGGVRNVTVQSTAGADTTFGLTLR
jgi:hypothetical protein